MYAVEVTSYGDSSFKVCSKDYEFKVDIKGKGITPPDTFLASLGSCIGVYIRKYADGAKIALGEFKVKVEAEFSQEKPFRFDKINVFVDIKNGQLDERRKQALLAFIKNCPIHNTLNNNPDIDIEIT